MTVPDQTRRSGLSDSQHLAIDVLLTGGTHREAAEAAGVARTTVTEWVKGRVGELAKHSLNVVGKDVAT